MTDTTDHAGRRLTRPVSVHCSAWAAHWLGAKGLPPAPSISGSRIVILVDADGDMRFWPVQTGALSNQIGHPANRRKGAII